MNKYFYLFIKKEMSSVKSFCLHYHKDTGNTNIKYVINDGRKRMTSLCTVCKNKKSMFVPMNVNKKSSKQSGKGIDSFIAKLPFEAHLLVTDPKTGLPTKASFIGPGTHLNKRLNADDSIKEWSKPKNELDAAAYRHDLDYRNHTDAAGRNIADQKLLQAADKYLKKPGLSKLDRIDGNIVKAAMHLIKRKV